MSHRSPARLAWVLAAALSWSTGALAQAPAQVTADEPSATLPAAAPVQEPAPAPAPAPEDLDPAVVDRAIEVLEDEAARQQVLDTLRALNAVEGADTAVPETVASPLDWLRNEIEMRVAAVETAVAHAGNASVSVTDFGQWLTTQATNPTRRAFWLSSLSQIGTVLVVASVVGWSLRRLLRRPRTAFESYAPPTPFHFSAALALHIVVRLLPIALFTGCAALIVSVLAMSYFTEAVTRSLVTGLAFVTALTGATRAILNVKNPRMRLFPLEEAEGKNVQRGIVRVITIGGYGYFALQAARELGLPWTLHGFLENVLFLVTLLSFVRLVLRFRRRGADGLRTLADQARSGLVGRFLPWAWIARFWHLGAIAFGLAIYGSWALDIEGGPIFLLRAVLTTLAIAFVARLFAVWITETRAPETARPSDDLEDGEFADAIVRAAQSPMVFAAKLLVTIVSSVLVLQAWSIDVIGWLASEQATSFRNALTTAAVTLGLAYVLWRLFNAAMRAAIEETDGLGRPARSSRSRTLLGIGRNVAFVIIWVTAVLLALNELGVNLAPLLAGAGVIGLAVGFGSQQLVQDIITGFFILLEDTIAVGDLADLGGKSGVVEAVSLRTVRLRAYDGQVHTIPFSQIATISNLTKDFSYYVFNIGVAYKEDVDRVMAVMADVGDELIHDRAFRRLVLAPLEIAGVDGFGDNAVMIKARIKTRPLQQWAVGREYNRRLKKRFDAEGIEIPFPQRTLHLMPGEVVAPFTPAAPSQAPTPENANPA